MPEHSVATSVTGTGLRLLLSASSEMCNFNTASGIYYEILVSTSVAELTLPDALAGNFAYRTDMSTWWILEGALLQYDVSEEIGLDEVRRLTSAQLPARGPEFRGPSPEYVKFAQPPLVYGAGSIELPTGEVWSCIVKMYEYGVVSVSLDLTFESDWDGLVQLASRWIGSADLERQAAEMAKSQVDRIRGALLKPYPRWTSEDYYTIHLRGRSRNRRRWNEKAGPRRDALSSQYALEVQKETGNEEE